MEPRLGSNKFFLVQIFEKFSMAIRVSVALNRINNDRLWSATNSIHCTIYFSSKSFSALERKIEILTNTMKSVVTRVERKKQKSVILSIS